MRFQHSPEIWAAHPTLAAGVIHADGITATANVEEFLPRHVANARRRLAQRPLSEFPEIKAWRQAFAAMGVKPTQYRCASESLLRRLDKGLELPRVHPLVDLCNHLSASYAIPVAALDLARITGDLDVRPANGTERYTAFSGDVEHPKPGEVIFADEAAHAHARRWTNRQSATSAIRDSSREVLIVIEALHDTARDDVGSLVVTLADELRRIWDIEPKTAMLSAQHPDFSSPTA
ncbi:B3/B4 domain-containing protein (DNA/RNA-binding domain of Phe-tRNA-synthetase) [Sinosporangium album]|uniref:B3/B4 domain-containing protein (DNA/RNA-binding domain of Phe-tRNA-synthetase) n=1 Tax=Sinosporangium album TaxID=504805 RepID=A0A1G7ZRB7_9ACTN|nr:phenylalanine--tRNA ligase beta subunit-related protein [Sinosporangium album]SDH10660.1 B3/B4 domain-containing protein (DNA/RNA-binding domain of Phe-tRNA-synthetase) [Sinosporangium album]